MVLSLKLTAKQRQLAMLTFAGKTQAEIARILHKNQSSLCHTWNGNRCYVREKVYGGIYSKFKKAISNRPDWQETFTQLKLKWE